MAIIGSGQVKAAGTSNIPPRARRWILHRAGSIRDGWRPARPGAGVFGDAPLSPSVCVGAGVVDPGRCNVAVLERLAAPTGASIVQEEGS